MARRPSARVVLNRAALDGVHQALAEGVEEIARTVIETTHAPDDTPFGVGLVKAGGWAVYSGSKKVGGGSLDGTQPRKPRALKTGFAPITGVAGFGFPARFQETGTVHQPARPFFMPAVLKVKGIAADIMRDTVGPKLKAKR